ncbi:MAG: hypothetical protein HY542_03390 [Deltaproteobacteria bacterium]|nr:hypothetical protein [Deltaproteobacteria bacterium]
MENVNPQIYEAFQKIKEGNFPAAEKILKEGLQGIAPAGDETQQALYHSTWGVLCKVKGEDKEAWRHYDLAEKLLPEDPSLKIISAKFLIERFAQFDTALKKLKKVLEVAKGSPSFEHQAHAIMALAYLKKGERKRAKTSLESAMAGDFQSMITAANINLDVIDGFLARNFEVGLCKAYLEKGLALAASKKEEKSVELFKKLLQSFIPPLQT